MAVLGGLYIKFMSKRYNWVLITNYFLAEAVYIFSQVQ